VDDLRTFVTEYDYDSFGKMKNLIYPDGEILTYSYDEAGQLTAIDGEKDGIRYAYLSDMGYDKFGQTVYQKLGNGDETHYTYDIRQRLQSQKIDTKNGLLTQNAYSYDAVDNILGITTTNYSHSYSYDALNRLIAAYGTAGENSYNERFSYDKMSNFLSKTTFTKKGLEEMTRNLTYTYNTSKPHAVSEVGGTSISYDKNGNPIVLESDTLFRYMVWDEENRLTCLTDDSYRSIYTYNHAGERVVKSHGPTESAYINGALQGVIHHNENTYTIYVNPFLVQTAQGFTKHIYNGNQRIATKLGTGEFKNRFVQDNYTQTAGNKDYIQKLNAIEHSREAYVKGHNTPPGVPTQKGLTGDVEFIAEAYPVVEFGNYDIPEGWENALAKPSQTGVPAQWENPNTTGFDSDGEEETNLYFFHSDHLGSTNYLTDKDGVVQQSLVYMPYGEILSETKTYSNPYKFNGKELDTETGLAYYGARYYSPELGVWYGVDPLMEKYPAFSPYVFCAGNPVRFVDVDGRDYGLLINDENKTITIKATYYTNSESKESAEQATSFFNEQSGNFTYKYNKQKYTVNFDLKVKEVENPDFELAKDNSGESNSYVIKDDNNPRFNENTNGRTFNGKRIIVKKSRKDTLSGTHEVGHTLGLIHSDSGIMTSFSNDSNRTNKLLKSDVKSMIKYPLKGKINYENDIQKNTKKHAGKGKLL